MKKDKPKTVNDLKESRFARNCHYAFNGKEDD